MASPEYTSMIECSVELTNDFSNSLPQIVDILQAKHLISPSVKEEALQPFFSAYSRASKLVMVLQNRVQIQPEALEEIVSLLNPKHFSLSLAAIKKCNLKLRLPSQEAAPQNTENGPPQEPALQNTENEPSQQPAPQNTENGPPKSATDPTAQCCDDGVNNQEEKGVQSTLDDLMVETGATLVDLGKECADNHLVKIAKKFTSVESLGGCLKLEDIEIAEVSRRQDLSLRFQLKAVLMKWKIKFGHKATYRWLVEMSLEEFCDAKTAELICKLSKETVPQEMEDQWSSGGKLQRDFFHLKALFFLCIGFLSILVPLISTEVITFPWLWAQKQDSRLFDKAPVPPQAHTSIQPPPSYSSEAPPSSKHSPHTGALTGTVIRRGDRSKMSQLRSFKLRNGETIDIVTQIGTQYRKFGQLLLENCNEVDIHEASCHHRPKCIVDRMLGDWLSGKGRLPVTWETLVSTLDEADMRILALDIRGQYSSKDEL